MKITVVVEAVDPRGPDYLAEAEIAGANYQFALPCAGLSLADFTAIAERGFKRTLQLAVA